jgi:hypothetical protein
MGRSPDLQGLRLDVYQFIRSNAYCTRDDIAKGLGLKTSTATARTKELIDLGYVIDDVSRKRNKSGVMSRCLVVSDRIQGGHVNEKLRVQLTLTVDAGGRYGLIAKVVGGFDQRGKARAVMRKYITLTLPAKDGLTATLSEEKVAKVTRLDSQQHAGQIIDGDYKIVEVE